MKTIKNNGSDLIVVEAPEDASDFWLSFDAVCFKTDERYDWVKRSDCFVENYTKTLQYTSMIVGKLLELSEEECSRFVGNLGEICVEDYGEDVFPLIEDYSHIYTDYQLQHHFISDSAGIKHYGTKTAKESLISLLRSNDIDTDKNLLLIEVL